jgi:hypothetical protein
MCSRSCFSNPLDVIDSACTGLYESAFEYDCNPEGRYRRRVQELPPFRARTDEEVEEVVAEWRKMVHPRVEEFFKAEEDLLRVLREFARGFSADVDPITCDGCAYWFGEVSEEYPDQPVMRLKMRSQITSTCVFVNRFLAFLFVGDETFNRLMTKPREPFEMTCGRPRCLCLRHLKRW